METRTNARSRFSVRLVWLVLAVCFALSVGASRGHSSIAALPLFQDDAIVRFKVHIPDDVLADLKSRLARTRFPDQVAGAGWEQGTSLEYLRELIAYWRDKFDWREQERRLNGFEQFKTTIDRKSTRLNSSHIQKSRMPSSA